MSRSSWRSPGTKQKMLSHPHWQCMVRWRVRCRLYAARSSRRVHFVAAEGWRGDGSARWWRLACGFVGSGPRGRGYAGGKISACCLVLFVINSVWDCCLLCHRHSAALISSICRQVEWPTKLQIAQGVIRGMNYLHTKTPPVVHADLKIQNVLIGDAYKAKVNAVSLFAFLSHRQFWHPVLYFICSHTLVKFCITS